MLRSYFENSQMYVMFLLWFVAGYFGGILAAAIILPSLFLLCKNDRFWEALIGLFFLIILSDNLEARTEFAQTLKGPYLLLLGLLVMVQGKRAMPSILIVSFFSIYFIVAIFCLQYSETFIVSLQKTVSYILLFLIVPNIVLVEYQQRGKDIFVDLASFMMFIMIVSIFMVYLFPDLGVSHGGRWRGMLGNPNGLGLLLIVSYLFFEVTRRIFPGLYSRPFQYVFYALVFILVIKTGSRNAMLSIGLFWLTFIMFSVNTGLGILFILAVIPFFNEVYEWLLGFVQTLGYGEELRVDSLESGSGRLIAWQFAWENIQKDTFILGKGIGYDEYLMRSNYKMLSMLGHEGGVHNTYLIIWLNTGLIGLISFFAGFLALFIRGRMLNSMSLPVMFAVMVSINFEPWLASSLNPFTMIFLIILTLLVYPIFYSEKESTEKPEPQPQKNTPLGAFTMQIKNEFRQEIE